ncbi:hypothetical protein MMC29_004872 [Sticta canariensis]|nr:hypothetical protein [Sticta canariensis]
MSLYNSFECPIFAPKPRDSVFFEDMLLSPPAETTWAVDQLPPASFSTVWPLSPPAETVYMVDQLPSPSFSTDFLLSPPAETGYAVDSPPPTSFSTNFPPAIPHALPPALLSTDWQPLDESQILPAADIQALCRAIGYNVPDFAAMPPVAYPLEPATSNPAGFSPVPTENVALTGFYRAGSTPVGCVPALIDNFAPAGLNRARSAPAAFNPAAFSPTGFAPMAYPPPDPVEPPCAEPVPAALNRR